MLSILQLACLAAITQSFDLGPVCQAAQQANVPFVTVGVEDNCQNQRCLLDYAAPCDRIRVLAHVQVGGEFQAIEPLATNLLTPAQGKQKYAGVNLEIDSLLGYHTSFLKGNYLQNFGAFLAQKRMPFAVTVSYANTGYFKVAPGILSNAMAVFIQAPIRVEDVQLTCDDNTCLVISDSQQNMLPKDVACKVVIRETTPVTGTFASNVGVCKGTV